MGCQSYMQWRCGAPRASLWTHQMSSMKSLMGSPAAWKCRETLSRASCGVGPPGGGRWSWGRNWDTPSDGKHQSACVETVYTTFCHRAVQGKLSVGRSTSETPTECYALHASVQRPQLDDCVRTGEGRRRRARRGERERERKGGVEMELKSSLPSRPGSRSTRRDQWCSSVARSTGWPAARTAPKRCRTSAAAFGPSP